MYSVDSGKQQFIHQEQILVNSRWTKRCSQLSVSWKIGSLAGILSSMPDLTLPAHSGMAWPQTVTDRILSCICNIVVLVSIMFEYFVCVCAPFFFYVYQDVY